MLCLMHEAEPRGHLLVNGVEVSPKQLAAMSSVPLKQCLALLEELEDAGVFSRENGVIFSRRMVDKTEYNEFVNMRPCPEVWSKIRTSIFKRDNFTCTYCGERGGRLECDHIFPVSRGGSNDHDNLATACFICNRSKAGKTIAEWRLQ